MNPRTMNRLRRKHSKPTLYSFVKQLAGGHPCKVVGCIYDVSGKMTPRNILTEKFGEGDTERAAKLKSPLASD